MIIIKIILILAIALMSFACVNEKTDEITRETNENVTGKDIYLTFNLSNQVIMQAVRYTNRYGVSLAGHLYMAKDIDKATKHPAIIIGPPYGGVKEQGPGLYANELAQRGFIALAFDPSFNGESGGKPRDLSSPDFFVEDFSAGVDYLGTLPFVDRQAIGVIGICGSGGFSLTAAQVDSRIKAVVTASMYDISSMHRDGFAYTLTDQQRRKTIEDLSMLRWHDFESGKASMPQGGWPNNGPAEVIPEGLPDIMSEFFEYYGMKRGWHPNTLDNFTLTSSLSFMNFPLMNYIETISPRPILFIIGEKGHSNYYSEEAYKRAKEPKELFVVPGARHIDLYDGGNNNYIPFDKIQSFFKNNL